VNPKSRIVLHSLAIIYDKTVQWVESDSIYTELIQSDSTDAQAFNNYSYSLVERGNKLDFALSLSKKAILLSPMSSAYLDTYGWIHYKIGNIDSAEIYIKKSVELEDTNTVVLEHLGDVLISKSKFEEAMIYFRRALELNPDNTVLRKKLSDL
jgi:Tfp pilus assembly protein PilF